VVARGAVPSQIHDPPFGRVLGFDGPGAIALWTSRRDAEPEGGHARKLAWPVPARPHRGRTQPYRPRPTPYRGHVQKRRVRGASVHPHGSTSGRSRWRARASHAALRRRRAYQQYSPERRRFKMAPSEGDDAPSGLGMEPFSVASSISQI
jgi:hypothetical protein